MELCRFDGVSYERNAKREKSQAKKKRLRIFICIALCFIFLTALIQKNVTNVLLSVAEASMRASTTVAVNDAVYFTLKDAPLYEDLVNVQKNADGEILSVSANALKINKIARDTASISQSNLKTLSANGIPIPLGAFTGIETLAGVGPKIKIDIIPVSSVTCVFSSGFESVGINQTKHSIYLNIIADISIVTPNKTQNFSVQTEVLVGECVLVGKIPETFLHTDLFGINSGITAK